MIRLARSRERRRARASPRRPPAFDDESSEFAVEQRLLDFADGARHVDAARARLDAVENRAAAPDAFRGVQNFQALLATLVTAVEDEPVRVDDGRRTHVIRVTPVGRTR